MKYLIIFALLILSSCRAQRPEAPVCEHPAQMVTCTQKECRCLICNATWKVDTIHY